MHIGDSVIITWRECEGLVGRITGNWPEGNSQGDPVWVVEIQGRFPGDFITAMPCGDKPGESREEAERGISAFAESFLKLTPMCPNCELHPLEGRDYVCRICRWGK